MESPGRKRTSSDGSESWQRAILSSLAQYSTDRQQNAPETQATASSEMPQPQTREWQVVTKVENDSTDFAINAEALMKRLQPQLEKIKPFLKQLEQFLQKASDMKEQTSKKYPVGEILKVGFALVLLLAGDRFMMALVCAQSFRMCGWQKLNTTLRTFQDNYISKMAALENRDGDTPSIGKAGCLTDVHCAFKTWLLAESQSDMDLAARRSVAIVKCADPNKMSETLQGLWMGIFAAIATFRSRFAFSVSLGSGIGWIVGDATQRHLQERLDKLDPAGRRLIDAALTCACIVFSSVAPYKMVSFGSALQSSTVLTKVAYQRLSSLRASESQDPTRPEAKGSDPRAEKMQLAATWSVAMIGFIFQVTRQDRRWSRAKRR